MTWAKAWLHCQRTTPPDQFRSIALLEIGFSRGEGNLPPLTNFMVTSPSLARLLNASKKSGQLEHLVLLAKTMCHWAIRQDTY